MAQAGTPSVSLWRIAKQTMDYNADDLSGGGAAGAGGRWNSKGKAVVYAASSIALAALETLVYLSTNIAVRNRFLVEIQVPEVLWAQKRIVSLGTLNPTWAAEPYGMTSVTIGDAWLAQADSALLLVPSVIIHEEFNILINPAHPQASSITATVRRQFLYDPRL